MSKHDRTGRLSTWVAVLVLVCLVAVIFFPIVGFEFVNFDVGTSVVENPYIRGFTAENVAYILTSPCIESYYPARTLTYVLDYTIWGLHSGGFKLTNCLLHLANVMLLFWLILRLFRHGMPPQAGPPSNREVAVATLASGIFAIHPLVVEPVTWVAGREELLMTLGALACIHFHLSARRLAERGGGTFAVFTRHALAALCCLVACLSNVIGAAIPMLVTACDWITLPKPKLGKVVRGGLVLWGIGTAVVLGKVLRVGVVAGTDPLPLVPMQQLRLALEVYWLNVRSLFWPTQLAISYDNRTFPASFLDREVMLGMVLVVLTCLLLWILRRKRIVLLGVAWFLIALAPALQLMPHHIHRADRFLYLPLAGLAVALAAGLRPLAEKLIARHTAAAALVPALIVVLLLGLRSAGQVETWRDAISMWENCVRVTPNDGFLHDALARTLASRGYREKALWHAKRSMELDYIDNHASLCNRAMGLALAPNMTLEDRAEAVRLAERACDLTDWKDPRCLETLPVVYSSLAAAQVAAGQYAAALENYRKAIQRDEDNETLLLNVALLLATCTDPALRNPAEAVRLAERALENAERPSPDALRILAEAYLATGQTDRAIAAAEQAVRIAQEAGRPTMVEGIRQWIESHRSRPKEGDGD